MKKFQYKKILIIKHGSLGDVLNSTSIIKAIYDKYNSSEIIILTTSAYSSFFKKFNSNFTIYNDERKGLFKTLKLLSFLVNKNINLIIDLQNSSRTFYYNIFFRILSKAKINSTHFFSNHRYKYSKLNPPSVIQGLSNQVNLLEIKSDEKPYLSFLRKNLKSDFNFLDKAYFIVNPGCSNKNSYKKWAAENYVEVCKYLINSKIVPVIIGSENDRESIEEIIKQVPDTISLINKSPLDIIYNISIMAVGAISNDTGPAHLIAATGCKIHLILCSKSNVKTVIPQSNNVTYNQADDINDIKPKNVFAHINKILNV
jgi:ADP-heptose:LPS heptosyltransferase